MLLWVIFAVMTAGALLAVLRPLALEARARPPLRGLDAAIYRDQLAELAEDLQRGRIAPEEAASARAEIARRLLAADLAQTVEAAPPAHADETRSARAFIVPASLALVPLLSLTLYLAVGSPGLPGVPQAARIAAPLDRSDMAGLIAKVEERLRRHPDDGNGWDVIAPVYLSEGRHGDAIRAYTNALRLLGPSAKRFEGYGEASVLEGDGVVSEAARKAFEEALKLEPGRPRSRFYLALALEQDGRSAEATEAYKALLQDAPADAPWRRFVEMRLAAIATGSSGTQGAGAPGPSEDDVAAAQSMTPEQRAAMINQMVAGLAGRLAKDGKDIEGWLRLIRAYTVLGNKDAARDAVAKARQNLAGDSGAQSRIKELAQSLGLEAS